MENTTYVKAVDAFDAHPDDSDLEYDDLLYTNNVRCLDQPLSSEKILSHDALTVELKRYYSLPVLNQIVPLDKTQQHIKALRLMSVELDQTLSRCYNVLQASINLQLKQGAWDILNIHGMTVFQVAIPDGYYSSVSDLLTIIQQEVNQTLKSQSSPPLTDDIFTLQYQDSTGLITISSAPGYTFTWSFVQDSQAVPTYRHLTTMLRFLQPLTIYSSQYSNQEHLAPCQSPQLTGPLDHYVWLKIRRFNHFYDHQTRQYYFAKIKITPHQLTGQAPFILPGYKIFYDGPLVNVSHLDIALYDRYGYLIDLQPGQMIVTLEMTTYTDRLYGTYYSSRRGLIDHQDKIEHYP